MAERSRLSEALRRHLEEHPLLAGEVHHIEIRHDHDCAHWKGEPCDCEPEIESGARVDRKYGGGEAEL